VAETLGRGEYERVSELTWTAALTQTFFGLLGALVLIMMTPLLTESILKIPSPLEGEAKSMFYILALLIPLLLVSNSFQGVLEASQRFDLVNGVRVLASSATFLVPLLGVLFGWSLSGIMALIVLVRAVALAVYWRLCFRPYPTLRRVTRPQKRVLRSFITFGGWVTVSSTVTPILAYLDRFIIGMLLGMSALAYYTAPYELVRRLGIVATSLATTIFPAFSALKGSEQHEKLERLFERSVRFLLLSVGPLTGIVVTLAEDILSLWLDPSFARESAFVFQILACGLFVNSIAWIPFSLLQALGRADVPPKFQVAMLPVQVVLLVSLTSKWGLTGTALAVAIRLAVDAMFLFLVSYHLYHLPSPAFYKKSISPAFTYLFVFTGSAYSIYHFSPWSTAFRLGALSILCIIAIAIIWHYALNRDERSYLTNLARSDWRWIICKTSSLS